MGCEDDWVGLAVEWGVFRDGVPLCTTLVPPIPVSNVSLVLMIKDVEKRWLDNAHAVRGGSVSLHKASDTIITRVKGLTVIGC
jgi:hypothetical protein